MKKFKVGFVGAGAVTRMHLKGYSAHPERIEVVAICDPSESNVQERADEFNIPNRYTDVETMIKEAGIEAAVVCTPSTIRESVITPLLEAGIPVFVEKPFADTLEEAKSIAEQGKRLKVPVSVNQNFRKHHKFEFIRGLIKEGAIGKLEGIHFSSLFFRQDTGWRIHTERHAMSVMSIHWFDGMRRMADADASSIYCTSYSSEAIDCIGETDATVQIVFDNGVHANFSQSFSSAFCRDDLVVLGSEAALRPTGNEIHLLKPDPSGQPNWNPIPVQTWKYAMPIEEAVFDGLNQLLEWIETGEEASNSAYDNLHTVSLLEGAYLSAREKRIVHFQDGLLS
ncbi:Gfo/Idh/MocA family protein [Paenibacillus sp. B01]|uniref:Gfo/Idh/MocA family protein n=1 Tax=Paenibacillus sp. B01 TaxID=2660554 RepID=UPI00129BEA54|nr:Gfo/Idh/MocA family oxidoreductase [Paenibacillus sp. B01]QGG55909.1 gfo/Idh/MocA family oxidoreductase [Paenibacillus sp. B01]